MLLNGKEMYSRVCVCEWVVSAAAAEPSSLPQNSVECIIEADIIDIDIDMLTHLATTSAPSGRRPAIATLLPGQARPSWVAEMVGGGEIWRAERAWRKDWARDGFTAAAAFLTEYY